MGDYYQKLDHPYFDYDLQKVEGLGDKLYRGPQVDLSKPYVACIGAAQTYGRFCERPFAHILSELMGIQVLNLGVGGAGPLHYLTDAYVDILNRAELVIFQVLAGRSASNSAFDNRQSGGLEGVRLKDGVVMRFEHFLEDFVATEPEERVRQIVAETRESYIEDYSRLMMRVNAPRLLLWFADRAPEYPIDYSSSVSILGRFPQMIDRSVVEALVPFADAYVECTSARGNPQRLWKSVEDIDGALSDGEYLQNQYYPSPEMHEDAAVKIVPVCSRFLPLRAAPKARSRARHVKFVVLATERTGTNLLTGLLDSHPQCSVGHELFNILLEREGELPWYSFEQEEREALHRIRERDPIEFIRTIYSAAFDKGYAAAGFKFMYGHVIEHPEVRDFLLGDPEIRFVHVVRRNLYRRLVSEKQAIASGVWAQEVTNEKPAYEPVNLAMDEIAEDIINTENDVEFYRNALGDKGNTIEVHYEDLASRPQAVANRVIRQLCT